MRLPINSLQMQGTFRFYDALNCGQTIAYLATLRAQALFMKVATDRCQTGRCPNVVQRCLIQLEGGCHIS